MIQTTKARENRQKRREQTMARLAEVEAQLAALRIVRDSSESTQAERLRAVQMIEKLR